MCSTGHQGAHGHEFLEFEYSYGEFTVGESDRNMSAVPTILITIHQGVFGMPTTPTTEMTALSEKRVRVFCICWVGKGDLNRGKSYPKVARWKRSKSSKLGSRELLRGRMGDNRQENMGISNR